MFRITILILIVTTGIVAMHGCEQRQERQEVPESMLTGDPAFDRLNREIEADPDNDGLFYKRALLSFEIEDYDAAIRDLARAMQIDSTRLQYHYLLSDAYLQNFQSQRALTTMQHAAAIDREGIETKLKLAELQLILKQYDAVYKTLGEVMEIDPRNTKALFLIGITYLEQGNTARAKQSFQTITEIDSRHADAWIMLGKIYDTEKDPLALRCYDNAIRVDSLNMEAWLGKALYLQNNDAVAEALDIYHRMHELDGQYADAYLNAGILNLEQDSLSRAQNEFHKLSKVDPANVLAYYYLGVIAETKGELGKALHQYEQAYNLAPDFKRAKEAVVRLSQKGQGEL